MGPPARSAWPSRPAMNAVVENASRRAARTSRVLRAAAYVFPGTTPKTRADGFERALSVETAAMIALGRAWEARAGEPTRAAPHPGPFVQAINLVAGTGFEPVTFRL